MGSIRSQLLAPISVILPSPLPPVLWPHIARLSRWQAVSIVGAHTDIVMKYTDNIKVSQ
jgi:hypothetical protein